MLSIKAKCLAISVIGISFSGCCTTVEAPLFVPPDRPVFGAYPTELWDQIPQEAQQIISDDDLAMKDYILEVESRAREQTNH